MIRAATSADAAAIAAIYNRYILETVVTFEEREVTAAEIAERIEAVTAAGLPWLVAEEGGELLGYAYAARWKQREAYRFVVETTVYLDEAATGNGLGRGLYERLLAELKAQGMHAAVGCIALPNEASVALHEKCGFEKVAHFTEVGFKFGRWIDVGYWQLKL